ncbi:ATP-binding protein [Clostridium sp. DL1XJH146]
MFYGRKSELKFLNSLYSNDKAQLVVLYGRRRIGKTELLRFFCKDKPHIFYACRETTDREQISIFSKKLLVGSSLQNYITSFNDWEEAFRFIKDTKMEGKKLVVIDEFPYMVNGNSSIPSILQNLWDEELKNENVMIILCGSSMSFIEKEILGEKNPLYGRTTGIYKLSEFGFSTSCNFFNTWSDAEKISAYSVFGGVPHYLNQIEKDKKLEENIKKHILTKGNILYNEVEFLMKQELRETAIYYTIIEAIAMGNTKLNDIYTKTGIDKTKISVYIRNLIELNILTREYPVDEGIKKTVNAHNGLYKIKDNYFKFYFRFVFPNITELEEGDVDGVYEFLVKPHLNEFVSFSFEEICIQYMRGLNKELKLPFRFSKIGRWWNKKDEIDVVAFDNKGNGIFGECKWKNSNMGVKDLNSLKEKSTSVKGNYTNKYYYLFSKSGFNEELIELAKIDKNVELVDLGRIF